MNGAGALVVASPVPAGGARQRTSDAFVNAALLSLAVAMAIFVKRYYSSANAEDLDWLLAPSTYLVESITGQTFAHEARVGYVAEQLPIVIAPACAGVNFLVIAFLTLVFGFVPRLRRVREKTLWFIATPILACGATLLANTVRIAAAVALHECGARVPLLSPAEVHRALGVVVYLGSLWILYATLETVLRKATS